VRGRVEYDRRKKEAAEKRAAKGGDSW
jgi:hypothetical protein